jgi:hypothetical protein
MRLLIPLLALCLSPTSASQQSPSSQDLEDLVLTLKQRRLLKTPTSLLPVIVNPFTPLLLCDYHYGGSDDVFGDIQPGAEAAVNTLSVNTTDKIKPCDIVCVNSNAFDSFVANVLPIIRANIILFTHRWCMPQVQKSDATEAVRAAHQVYHWFAQNPVYPEDDRYSAFPYGIRNGMLEDFSKALLAFHDRRESRKDVTLEHLHLSLSHPSRLKLIDAGLVRGRRQMHGPRYYSRIAGARFLISPRGDRPDTYRHWEAIGLGAIPIANIDRSLYFTLFGDDMIYVNDTAVMLGMIDQPNALKSRYHKPQSGRVSTAYWARKVRHQQEQCKRR